MTNLNGQKLNFLKNPFIQDCTANAPVTMSTRDAVGTLAPACMCSAFSKLCRPPGTPQLTLDKPQVAIYWLVASIRPSASLGLQDGVLTYANRVTVLNSQGLQEL